MGEHVTARLLQDDDFDPSMTGEEFTARTNAEASFVTPPSTATSSTETVSTNDEDARRCEEWELFSNFDGRSRPSDSRIESHRSTSSESSWESANESARTQAGEGDLEDSVNSSTSDGVTDLSEAELIGEDEETEETRPTLTEETADEQAKQPQDTASEFSTDEAGPASSSARDYRQEENSTTSSSLVFETSRSTASATAAGVPDHSPAPIATSSRIQVFVRIRPPGRGEADTVAVKLSDTPKALRVQSTHLSSVTECAVDRIFVDTATQEEVYSGVERGVQAALDGINATIFAYGQTGTGKTHTMFGDDNLPVSGDPEIGAVPEEWGVIPRALCELMTRTRSLQDQAHAKLTCSFLQIYNDRVFDLLTDRKRQKPLIVREQPTMDGGTNVVLQGLSSEAVTSLGDALQLVRRGRVNRSVRETELNASSSRSHAIVQVHLTIEDQLPNGDKRVRSSRLNLVDLAGSEKWNTDLEMEDRHTVELKNINTSLSALGNCIAALAESGRRHIPYRDSTLTRLLQDSFGGNTLAFLIATVSPSHKAAEETIRTLQFADRARSVMQVVKVNESFSGNSELLAAKAQIKQLRERLTCEQRRRHETRLKENEAMQQDFATKLQAKEDEIQRLARDNEVFAKWRAEDVARIRTLEARVKEMNDEENRACHEERPEQTWQPENRNIRVDEEDIGGVDACQKSKIHQDNQAVTAPRTPLHRASERVDSDKRQPIDRKPSMKSAVSKQRHADGSYFPAASSNDKAAKSRVKSYRSLLEKYALPSQKGKGVDPPQRDPRRSIDNNATASHGASHGVSIKSTEPTHEFNREQDPVASCSPEKRAPLGRSTSDSTVLAHANAMHPSKHDEDTGDFRTKEVPTNQTAALHKADSLPALTVSQHQQQQQQQQQHKSWGSFVPQTQTRQEYTRANTYNTSSDISTKQAWQLPPMIPDANPFTVVRSDPATSSVTAPSETCVKHSLKGCVLCAVKDASWAPTGPQNSGNMSIKGATQTATTHFSSPPDPVSQVVKTVEDSRPCERHQLPGCFICTKTSSASVWKTAAVSSTGSTSSLATPSMSTTNSFLGPSASVTAGLSMASQDTKCSTHRLANCVICAGNTNYRGPAVMATPAPSVEYTSPTKRSVPEPPWLNIHTSASISSPASSFTVSSSLGPPSMTSAVRDRGFPTWESHVSDQPTPLRALAQTQSLSSSTQGYQYAASAAQSSYGLAQSEQQDPGVVLSPIRMSANNMSSSSSPSPALHRSVKELSNDMATRRQFNSLVREASDAANVALRRRA